MIYQMVMGFAVIVFMLLVAFGIQFGAPLWFFFASVPASPVLSFGFLLLIFHITTTFEDRARLKRRAAASERRSKGL